MGDADECWVRFQAEQGYSMLRITPARFRLHQPCITGEYEPKAKQRTEDAEMVHIGPQAPRELMKVA